MPASSLLPRPADPCGRCGSASTRRGTVCVSGGTSDASPEIRSSNLSSDSSIYCGELAFAQVATKASSRLYFHSSAGFPRARATCAQQSQIRLRFPGARHAPRGSNQPVSCTKLQSIFVHINSKHSTIELDPVQPRIAMPPWRLTCCAYLAAKNDSCSSSCFQLNSVPTPLYKIE